MYPIHIQAIPFFPKISLPLSVVPQCRCINRVGSVLQLSDSTFALASTKFFYINHVDALLDRSSCSKKIQELYAIFKFAEIHVNSLHRSESELREFRNKLFIFIDVMILIWVVWNFWCGKHIMWSILKILFAWCGILSSTVYKFPQLNFQLLARSCEKDITSFLLFELASVKSH